MTEHTRGVLQYLRVRRLLILLSRDLAQYSTAGDFKLLHAVYMIRASFGQYQKRDVLSGGSEAT